ncbi:MAG TPA: type VI secretion system tube protein Hcp [Candidatus Sulfotelmatobacter sp.]|nr:type VI secretion system tube protein Hcp [Candidatus Sulfotelmatobacter sp.]
MASDYYLKIDGVEGESVAVGMEKTIELDSFSFGATNPADVGGGGLSAGKCSLSDFSFSCPLDSSSYQILKNLYAGTHVKSVIFTGRKSGGSGTPYNYLICTMTNCYVTSHSTGGGATGMPTQSVSLAYEQIKFEYYTQDTDSGATKQKGNATYNIGQVQQT